jgi:hypothetical protein
VVERAGRQALAAVDAGVGPRGQWPGQVQSDTDPAQRRPDMAAPLTALGMLALRDVPTAQAAALVRRSAPHVELTMRPGGWWRYYANIPPDGDDTAMCALALGREHPSFALSAASLGATRRPDGLFPTWLEPGWDPVVDAVANAHIVAVVGPGDHTARTVAWLNDVVAQASETASSAYYRDPLDLHVALVRALRWGGVVGLRDAVGTAARRAAERLALEAHLSAYRRAQAMVVCAAGQGLAGRGTTDGAADVLMASAEHLLSQRADDGTWPTGVLYVAGNTAGPGVWQYQSWAVTTALCVAALHAAAGSGASDG